VVRDTEVGAIEEVIVEANTIEEPEVKTVTLSSQTYQSDVTKTSETRSDSIKIPLFSLRMFIGDNDTIHYYTELETYETLLFVLSTLGSEVHVLNYMYGTISQTEVVDRFFLVLMKLRRYTTNFELSRLFNISESDVYNIFVNRPTSCHLHLCSNILLIKLNRIIPNFGPIGMEQGWQVSPLHGKNHGNYPVSADTAEILSPQGRNGRKVRNKILGKIAMKIHN